MSNCIYNNNLGLEKKSSFIALKLQLENHPAGTITGLRGSGLIFVKEPPTLKKKKKTIPKHLYKNKNDFKEIVYNA